MTPVSVSRALRLGATGAVAAALTAVGLAAAPASAGDEQSDQLWIQVPYEKTVTVAPAGGSARYRDLPVGLHHDNSDFSVTDGRLTVDASGLAGVAEVAWPDNCVPSGATAVCSVPEVPVQGWGYEEQVKLKVRALSDATSGAQGKITYEASAKGGPEGELVAPHNSFDTTVTVGSGPDLGIPRAEKLDGARPGSTVTAPVSAVTNTGNEPANGFTLQLWATYGLDFATKYPQCTYTAPGAGTAVTRATCAFDTVVEPGATVELPGPLKLDIARHALYERIDFGVEPAGGATDIQTDDNNVSWIIEATNKADFEVRGGTVRGKAGTTVPATFTFLNRGPAWVGHLGSGDAAAVVRFHVPEGTRATAVPESCEPRALTGEPLEARLGAPRYDCYLPIWVKQNTKADFPFTLTIDRVVKSATGTLEARPDWGTSFPDPNPRNNTSKLVVNP
ncbi:hypothetical protein [Streptomyces sp. ALI-76-A]|uniref:hypothetical protein n=1 Tax=Streptomyces sp. ALI-76-A TaxID=3025736 RepID=UPI00256EF3A0|nr:hypothetical protein [Streptomyces sp. ALI-76-A]MDL5206243.1 hypothetical protein [Streptomyces sp. ALI-76-A]